MKRRLSLVLLTFLTISMLLPNNASATIEWANNATSLVASDITSGATSVTVTTGQGDRFPVVASPHYFMMTLIDVSGNREIVKVTARTAGSNTMTIVRAQEGTSAQAFAAGSYVDQRITKHSLDSFSQVSEQFVNYYVCDASAADQADTVNSESLASLAATIGTSRNATIVLPHTGSGNTTAYNVLQNLDLSTYDNITFLIKRGAVITHGANTIDMPAPQAGFYQITDQSPVFSGAGAVTLNAIPDVASATALPVLSPGYMAVTGTTTITSINSIGIDTEIILQFDAALTIEHDGTNIILPSANHIVTRAGDVITFREYATGDWEFVSANRPVDSKLADLASNNELLVLAPGFADVTGTNTITFFSSIGIGSKIILQFDSTATLTHDATNLILPGKGSITTAAGDIAEFVESAAGDWLCTNYTYAQIPAFSVHNNGANQNGIVTATWTKIVYSSELFDTRANYTSSRFTPKVAGKYSLSAAANFTAGVDQSIGAQLAIYKNGGALHYGTLSVASGAGPVGSFVGAEVDANGTTDYFEIFVFQGSGSNKDIDGVAVRNWFSGGLIGQ